MAPIGTRRLGPLALCAVAVLVGGCGEATSGEPATAGEEPDSADFPVTVRDASERVVVEAVPSRIVSLSPSATETLYAVGAGDQVVAVDDESDFPEGVPRTELSSYQPNVEAIAGYEPDLVIVPATVPRDVIAGLRRIGLTVLAEPAPERLAEAYEQFREIGAATGHAEAGRELAEETAAEVDRLVSEAPDGGGMRVFHELDPELFSASSQTFIGRIYRRLGLENVADGAARRSGNPYPQLSSEGVAAADPDLIVLADTECCDQTPEKAAARPGWASIAAVREDAVVGIDDDIASRWGPRIPLFVERVSDAMVAGDR